MGVAVNSVTMRKGRVGVAEPIITFQHVYKRYDDTVALGDIDFELEQGKFYTLLGPSGCGKTTILRILAGFTEASEGKVTFKGQQINRVPANQRQINTVFQDYALFPHLNVFDNVAFGLTLKRVPKKEIKRRVLEALHSVRLAGYEDREISELSGGQQQRVAIARAIVNEPQVLLLDEPLSALDAKLRTAMQVELRQLQRRLGITFLFVTHDQGEALAMSDEIFVMNEGRILQQGSPVDIYDEPINHFVADFIGESNIVKGRMVADYQVQFVGKQFECSDAGIPSDEPVEIVLRPEDLVLTDVTKGKLTVIVDTQVFRGNLYEILSHDADGNQWLIHAVHKAKVGQKVGIYFEPEDIHVMRFGESEAEFDARLEQYEGDD